MIAMYSISIFFSPNCVYSASSSLQHFISLSDGTICVNVITGMLDETAHQPPSACSGLMISTPLTSNLSLTSELKVIYKTHSNVTTDIWDMRKHYKHHKDSNLNFFPKYLMPLLLLLLSSDFVSFDLNNPISISLFGTFLLYVNIQEEQ